jgi:DNA-binding response OmpR family regulator
VQRLATLSDIDHIDQRGGQMNSAALHDLTDDSARGPLVLLVEDEVSISEPFSRALQRAGFRTAVAATGAEAMSLTAACNPDVVLLDLTLPDSDGRDICRQIRRNSPVPIIMVTASGTVTDRVVGLELGADDYVVKPFAVGEVIARIRAVLRRARPLAESDAERAVQDLRIDSRSRRAWRGTEELELSRKEFDLLHRLARDPGRVVGREELMADVWDVNWFGSTKTLDVHIGWLRRKLEDDPAEPRYIRTVRGVGFCLAADQRERKA